MSSTVTSEQLFSNEASHCIKPTTISLNASLYKTPRTKNTQAQRRHELLEAIKGRRNASMDEKRNIHEVFNEIPHPSEQSKEEPMDTVLSASKRKKKKFYANKLMLSEWLLEKPFDFEEKWLMKICPKGVRNLVVANKSKTKCFSKSGHFIRQFQSQLPGGSSSTPMRFTILDCVYQQEEEMFYVLDVLVWNSYSVMNSSSEFRFFFIESKLQESDLQTICKGNEYQFAYARHQPADFPTVAETFANHLHNVDGVLFYHSEVSYLSQVTPLVGWLKIFMLPEVLNLPVHSDYFREKPETYSNLVDFVQNFDKLHRLERKRNRWRKKGVGDVEMAGVGHLDDSISKDCFDVIEEAVMDD